MSENNIGYAPDMSFTNEIVVSGTLEVTSVATVVAKMSRMTDLIGSVGVVEGGSYCYHSCLFSLHWHCISGKLHLKVGRGPKEITVRSTEYRAIIVYDGIHRVSVLFPSTISTRDIKRGVEIVFHKLRLLRLSDGSFFCYLSFDSLRVHFSCTFRYQLYSLRSRW